MKRNRMLPGLVGLICLMIVMSVACMASAGAETLTYQGKVTADVNAEEMDLGNFAVTEMNSFVKFLRQFPNLKKVDMFATKMYAKDMDLLAAEFPDIEFGWTMRIGDHWVRTDTTAFSTLHNNRSPLHTENQFRYLKYCKNLLALDIGHNTVKNLDFLYDLPKLKVLIVACNIDLKDITPIGSLKELEYLELFKNDINDISCLTECTKLIDLNICFNRVKDWTPLHELKNLERLWLYNSNNYSPEIPVDKNVVYAIKNALPDCHVDSTSYSTLGGWREHDRYYVIYHMFKHSEYIPFDRAAEIHALYPNGINLD